MTPDRLRSFFDLWNAHDVDGIVGYFTADGVYMTSIGPDDGAPCSRAIPIFAAESRRSCTHTPRPPTAIFASG